MGGIEIVVLAVIEIAVLAVIAVITVPAMIRLLHCRDRREPTLARGTASM